MFFAHLCFCVVPAPGLRQLSACNFSAIACCCVFCIMLGPYALQLCHRCVRPSSILIAVLAKLADFCISSTGWQLLAQSVQPSDADTLSSAPGASSQDQRTSIKQAASRVKHRRSPSDMSRSSSMSDGDSGAGPAAAAVTPRPHQWLYKEYKIQDEIGSGGFGRVCRCTDDCIL
eukprot:GHUV01044810.1.p1 GENE.GHUV01044810.1~~GHUV01044810.1.p1  ORF type:complete len:174 (-),score=23.90 GHUV01044810.1:263-784(-)